jgi:hypothetical protein
MNIARTKDIGLVSAVLDRQSHVSELFNNIMKVDGGFTKYIKPISAKSIPELGEKLFIDVKDV